jgi:hypothetical protein
MAREVTPIQLPVATPPMDETIWMRMLAIGARSQPVALVAVAAAAPVALAVGLLPLRGQIPSATVALGLAVLVSALAAIGGRLPAAITASSPIRTARSPSRARETSRLRSCFSSAA